MGTRELKNPEMLGKSKRAYFSAAKALSDLSDYPFPIGCVVVHRHRIISSGYNSKNNRHGYQARIDKQYYNVESIGCKHAEMDALLPFLKNTQLDISQATIYIYRQNKLGKKLLARPCPICMSVIKKLGIKRIEYTTDLGFASEVLKY